MARITVYLNFDGNCREAMTFYKEALGGELTFQTVGESPMAGEWGQVSTDKILHASLVNDNLILMASDLFGGEQYVQGNSITMNLECSSEEEIHRLFANLSAGGQVIDPLKEQFWGAIFGMLTDKFGMPWMFNYNKNPQM